MKVSVFCSLWGVFKACSWKDLLLIWPKYCVRIKIITFSSSQNNYLAYLSMGNQIGVGLMPPCAARIQHFNDWRDFFFPLLSWCFILSGLKFLVFFHLLISAGNTSALTKMTKAGLINISFKKKYTEIFMNLFPHIKWSKCRCECCAFTAKITLISVWKQQIICNCLLGFKMCCIRITCKMYQRAFHLFFF